MIKWTYDDGGRAEHGYRGHSRDCVCRALAIASSRPYPEIYARLAEGNANQRNTRRAHRSTGQRTASNGIQTQRKWFKDYMAELGFVWTPTMAIGTGCQVHLSANELPMGRLIVNLSRHSAAVIDRVLYDTHDCSRDGTRCVYGYWEASQ